MQVCTSLQADNHASTAPLSFLQAGRPSCRPTNSVKALKEHLYVRNDNRKPQSMHTLGFSTHNIYRLILVINTSWVGFITDLSTPLFPPRFRSISPVSDMDY